MSKPDILSIVFLALAVSAVSLTTSRAKIFSGLREKIAEKNEWLGDLVGCPYCTSHWVSFLVVAFYRPVTVTSGVAIVDMVISAFVLVALAAMLSWIIYRSYRGLDLPGEQNEDQSEEVERLRSALQIAKEKLVEQNELLQKLSEQTYENVS